MIPPSINDYYHAALESARVEVQDTSDARMIGMDPVEWTNYLVAKYGMEPVEADPDVPMKMIETSVDGYPAVRVVQAMIWTETLTVIEVRGLAGSPGWVGFDYTEFFEPGYPGTIGLTVPPEQNQIANAKRRIGEYIQALNSAINHQNTTFPGQIRQIVDTKQSRVREKHKKLDDLAAAVGIQLVKRADISTVIPTAVRVRKQIAPLVPPTPREQRRPVLERDKFDGIVELIDNQCRQFERTPTSFQDMGEERLRDVMLGSLNAVFEGAAGGEVFQGLGKTDIHLRITQGEVFIAEIKIWDGPKSLAEVVQQLLERLTWRDAFGVAIVISKNADFGAVLRSIEATLPGLQGVGAGSVRKTSSNTYIGRFSLPSDSSTQVEIHVRAYNLFTSRPAGRAALS
jgi:hypothetical protein